MVLKCYDEAVKNGDNILGIIRGTAVNNDGPEMGIGTPSGKAQERVYREALARSQLEPHEVSLCTSKKS